MTYYDQGSDDCDDMFFFLDFLRGNHFDMQNWSPLGLLNIRGCSQAASEGPYVFQEGENRKTR